MQGYAPPQTRRKFQSKTLLKLSGPAAPAIQAIAATSPGVARQLVSWSPSYAHAIGIFLQANGATDRETAKRLFMSDAKLQKATSVDLLRRAGCVRPSSLSLLLDRLTGRLWPLDRYRKWDDLLADRKLVGFISSCKALTCRKLEALAQLPPELRSERIFREVQASTDVEALILIVDAVRRACPGVPVDDIHRSLRKSNAKPDHWLKRWFCRADLPEPPFPGNDLLVPLRTGAAVKETARTFRNCLTYYLDEAVAGRIVLYLWSGKEPALVAIRPLGQLGWTIDAINGPANIKPAPATKALIISQLASWGCCTGDDIQHSLRKWGAWAFI